MRSISNQRKIRFNSRTAKKLSMAAAVFTTASAFTSHGYAQTNTVYTYTGGGTASAPVTGNFNNSANWLGGAVPTSASSTELDFGGSGATAYTATDDLGGAFILTALNLSSTATVTETIASSATANTLSFANNSTAAPVINTFGTGAFNISSNIVLNNTTYVGGTGTGPLTFAGAVSGANAVVFNNSIGTANFAGANTYTGNTTVTQGSLNFAGSSTSSGSTQLDVGNAYTGNAATVTINTTGLLSFNNTITLGEAGGIGALTQTSGTLNGSTGGSYPQIGNNGYGSFTLNGGTFNAEANGNVGGGLRIGGNQGGNPTNGIASVGIFTQNAGTFTVGRYMAIGSGTGAGSNISTGMATFVGGSATQNSAYRTLIGDGANSIGIMNMGTEAGGTNIFTAGGNSDGILMHDGAGATSATLNLNKGTVVFPYSVPGIAAGAAGTSTLDLNGAMLQTTYGAAMTVISNANSLQANVYNGGANFNTTISGQIVTEQANLIATTGNGIYVPGGTITLPAGTGGTGYAGAPLVAVSGGGGTGAMAVANVSNGVVTGISITNPGQGYALGSTVSFTFSSGNTSTGTAAQTYNYTFGATTDPYLTANAGGLNKYGAGILSLTGTNTYNGPTTIYGGILEVGAGSTSGNLGATSSVNISSGSFLAMNLSSAYTTAAPFTGAGGLVQLGAGNTTLSGAVGYTGPTNISNGALTLTAPGGTFGSSTITVTGAAAFNPQPGTGTLAIGSGSSSLLLNPGTKFNMSEGAVGKITIANSTGTPLSITSNASSPVTFTFDLGQASTDQLAVTGLVAMNGSNDVINVVPLSGLTSINSGNYSLITASGGLVPADFVLGGQNITVNGTTYHLSLANSTATAEVLSVSAVTGALAQAYWAGSLSNNWQTNNSGSTNWRTDATSNIDTSKIPDQTTNVYFTVASGGSNLTTTLGANQSINSLTFDGYASGPVTIGGAYTLTINALALNGNTAGNGITMASGATTSTISANVSLAGNQVWTNNSTNPLVVSGSVSGQASLTSAGSGPLVLSGSNSYTGGLNATGGALYLNNASALGTGTFIIGGGISLDNSTGSAITLSTNNPQLWNNDFTFVGSNDLNMGSGAVSLGSSRTVTLNAGNLSVGSVTDSGLGYTLTTTGAGNLAITSGLQGTSGLHLTGTGVVTLAGSGNYTGVTNVSNGTLSIVGSSTGNGTLDVGNVVGQQGVVTIDAGSGTVNFNGGGINIGDIVSGSPVAGALNINSGTVNLFNTSGGAYVNIGNGGYGSLNITGGNVTIGSPAAASGLRSASTNLASVGVITQTGGNFTLYRYLALSNAGYTVATFTGGTTTLYNYRTIVGDTSGTVATFNLGTLAGGSNFFTTGGNGGLVLNLSGSSTSTANLDAGTLNLSEGSVYNGNTTSGTATVNLNGAVIQAGVNGLTLIDTSLNASPNSVNVYNGGANFNVPSGLSASVTGNLLATTGNGVYTGNIAVPSGSGGTGYIGSIVALVQGGSGNGAMAVANVNNGVVTSVSMTNPGQGYQAGDTLSFLFSDGGINTTASGFNYTLTSADLAANNGGLSKLGTGTLTLSGTNTYTGNSLIKAGTVVVQNTAALGTGSAVLSDATTLKLGVAPGTTQTNVQTGFANFKLNSNGVYTPTISPDNSTLNLTSPVQAEANSAFITTPVTFNDATGFSVSFTYNHGTVATQGGPADGVMFVVQNQSNSALGAAGGGFGYLGINNSMGAAVDLYHDEIVFGLNGSNIATTAVNSVPGISANQVSNVSIVYNGLAQTLTETISNATGTVTSTYGGYDLAQILGGSAGGSGVGYFGFTGATGGNTDTQSVSNFVFNTSSALTAINISNPVIVNDASSSTIGLASTFNYGTGAVGPITVGNGSKLTVSISTTAAPGVKMGVLSTPSVAFTNTSSGQIDIGKNALDITSQSLAAVNGFVASGFNLSSGGYWNGPGIVSSAAAADSTYLTSVGVISNTDVNGHQVYGSGTSLGLFMGINPAATDVLVKYTFYGDANLDGAVDGSDYTLIDNGFNNHLTGWYNGDFNYDGVIDGSDYTLIDNAFNTQGASLGSNPAALVASTTAQVSGGSAVPEPATLGVLGMGAMGLLARRRRKC